MVGPYESWSEDFPVGGQKMELFSGVRFSGDSILEWSKLKRTRALVPSGGLVVRDPIALVAVEYDVLVQKRDSSACCIQSRRREYKRRFRGCRRDCLPLVCTVF